MVRSNEEKLKIAYNRRKKIIIFIIYCQEIKIVLMIMVQKRSKKYEKQ